MTRARRLLLTVTACAVLGAACGGDVDATTTTEPPQPATAVVTLEEFLDALRAGDHTAAAGYVDADQLAILTAIEQTTAEALFEMDDLGVPDDVQRNFWSAFLEASPDLTVPESITVGAGEEYVVEGETFAEVEAVTEGGVPVGSWVLRRVDDGWTVDVIATFGAAFARPVDLWLAGLAPEERARAGRLVAEHRASWQVLGDRQPDDEVGVAVRTSLDALLNRLGQFAEQP